MPPGLLASCRPGWPVKGLLGLAALGYSHPSDTQAEILPWIGFPLNPLVAGRIVNNIAAHCSGPAGLLATSPGFKDLLATTP